MGRILIVEDDPWSRRIVCDLLEMHGYEVLAAADLGAARALLDRQPMLVLLDIHVPGGGGQALLAEIRAREGMAALPVIAFTASAMAGDRERFLKEGFTGYLSKPIDVKEFARTIASYL